MSILEGSDKMTRKELINSNVDVAVLCEPVDELDAIPIAMDQLVALIRADSALSKTTCM